MPTTLPRINVTLERPLLRMLQQLAHRDDTSVSMKVRDLLRDALEVSEDMHFAKKADKRRATFNARKGLRHSDVW